MEKKTVSAIMLTLLLTSMLTLAFNIQPVRAEPAEIIIDTEVGESRFTTYPARQSPYYWVHVQDHDTFRTRAFVGNFWGYGGSFWYTLCGADGTGQPLYSGQWEASLPYGGLYEVLIWIPNPDPFEYDGRVYTPTQNASYQIHHKNGTTVKTVDQRLRIGGWYSVGTFTFDTLAKVVLSDRTGEPYLSTMIAFDAVKFVCLESAPDINMYVDPATSTYYSNTTPVGSTFTVDVVLKNMDPLHDLVGIEFKLYWDPTMLEGMSMVIPAGSIWQEADDDSNLWKIKMLVDKVAGYCHYIVTCSELALGYTNGYLPLDATPSGIAARITLKIIQFPAPYGELTCPLHLVDTKLANGDGAPITHTKTDGHQPPTCVIKLQKDGVEIYEAERTEFFDIYVGDSTDDTGIKQVHFSSDDVRDNMPTGEWTKWYNWSFSSGDWGASTRIKRWAFATPGYKEVWAEVIDDAGQTAICSATIFVPTPALPVLVSPLIISPAKDMYSAGDSLTAEFTVENIGEVPITLDNLTLGGRLNGWIQADGYPDFTHRQVTLQPHVPYQYSGSLILTQTGNYRFFVAYHIADPNPDEKKLLDENNWNTCIELGEGLTQTARVKNVIVFEEGTLPEESQLREMINQLIGLNPYLPPYLLGVDSFQESVATLWAGFTSWATGTDLTGKYDELYQTGLKYYGLRLKALTDARSSLDRGDIEFAKKCVTRSRTYSKLADMSFAAAAEVFDGNMAAGQVLAEGIREGCEAATRFGIAVVCPAAALKVDAFYMGMNLVFNVELEGWEQTKKDLVIDIAFTAIFEIVQFKTLGYNTLENYVNTVSANAPLDTLLDNKEFIAEFGIELKKVITDRIAEGITEEVIEKIVEKVIRYYESMKDSLQTKKGSPVELRVVDSKGQITGLVNNRVKHGIPMSLYYNETVTILFPADTYQIEVFGADKGTYGLEITLMQNGQSAIFNATGIPVSVNTTHQYTVDWTALSRGEEGVTVKVDSDGDGVPEHTFTSDSELTRSEFLDQTGQLGDINADGNVDVLDAVILSAAAGSWKGHPRWNPDADLNDDGLIDVFDAVILSSRAKQAGT